MKLFVADLPYDATEEDLRKIFGDYGEVLSVNLPADHVTGTLKGTALVEMATLAEAEQAAERLRRATLHGRRLRVRLALEHELAEMGQPLLAGEPLPPPHERRQPYRPERSPGR
jgi:RNA recognition motif-containing protein